MTITSDTENKTCEGCHFRDDEKYCSCIDSDHFGHNIAKHHPACGLYSHSVKCRSITKCRVCGVLLIEKTYNDICPNCDDRTCFSCKKGDTCHQRHEAMGLVEDCENHEAIDIGDEQ